MCFFTIFLAHVRKKLYLCTKFEKRIRNRLILTIRLQFRYVDVE